MSSLRESILRRIAFALVALCLTGLGCGFALGTEQHATVVIGGVGFDVEIAVEPGQKAKGLSGRVNQLPKTGMLFLYEPATAPSFWMKGMEFPLDFVWIGRNCTVVDITAEVPPPALGTPDRRLERYSSGFPAAYNLEINAGEAMEYGLAVGDSVRFERLPAGIHSPCG